MHTYVYKTHTSQYNLKYLEMIYGLVNLCDEINFVNFVPVAFFSEAKLTTSSGKHIEKVDSLHPICSIYKLLTSSQQTRQLMYGFEESITIGRQELTNTNTEEGIFFGKNKTKRLVWVC